MSNEELFSQDSPISLLEPDLKQHFDIWKNERSFLETRWEEYAGWSLPYIFPSSTYSETDELQLDYQSVGAQAVNHLINKIIFTLFHPSRSFFRLDFTEEQKEEATKLGLDNVKLNEMASAIEKQSLKQMNIVSLRTALLHAMKSLVITGNSLLFLPNDGNKAQSFNLKDYVIRRDNNGRVLGIILKDAHMVRTLPQQEQAQVLAHGYDLDDKIELFTGIFRRKDGKWITKQDIDAVLVVNRKKGLYTDDTLPWIPLTWNYTRGNHYGTGLVEEYAGDFHTLSTLAQTIFEMSAIASDIKILVNPMGQTDIREINDAASGTAVYGVEGDITFLQLDKLNDLSFIDKQIQAYSRRIGSAFLLNTAVVRDAERVTAEEIRMQAQELEESLGGVYSRLAEELQQPLARRLLASMDSALNELDPVILTGVESLSRTSDLEQMLLFFQDVSLLNDLPEDVRARLNIKNVLSSLGAARQVEYQDWILSEEELEEKQQSSIQTGAAQEFANTAAQGAAAQQFPQG